MVNIGRCDNINLSPIIIFVQTHIQYYFKIKIKIKTKTTSNNGYLGSRNDEDRSEFRLVMRIAELVNHQNVERKLHFLEMGSIFV